MHGTTGKALKETAASNMGHFWQKLSLSAGVLKSESAAADYYCDPSGNPKPIMVQEMDNSHGAADIKHCFMLGLDFILNDRDANIGDSFAGQYSRFEAHEAVNGSLANRTNGAPMHIPLASPETARNELPAALEICCDKLIAVANGATMQMGGGHITVVRSNLDAASFNVRPDEINRFVDATEAEKKTFCRVGPLRAVEQAEADRDIALYQLVWRCMQNDDPATRIYLRSPHLVQWIKRALDVNTFLKPKRAPAAFHSLLESWGGFLAVVVPSNKPEKQPNDTTDTGGGYAGLGESIERAAELATMAGVPGKHYPPALLDAVWKMPNVNLVATWEATGDLPPRHWSNLRKLLRQPRSTLTKEFERRLAIVKRKIANVTLEKAQEAAGVQQAVIAYMLSVAGGGDKRVKAMQTLLNGFGMPKRDVPKHRAQCIAEIFKRKGLTPMLATAPAPLPVPPTHNGPQVAVPVVGMVPVAMAVPVPVAIEAAAATAVQQEAAAEAALQEAEAAEADGNELAGGASSGSEDEDEGNGADDEPHELPPLEPVALATVEEAEHLLDGAAAHAERPTSMWGCCGGVCDGRHYYCDSCSLYFHEGCQKNQSKGRQAPLCPACHTQALKGGRSSRRCV